MAKNIEPRVMSDGGSVTVRELYALIDQKIGQVNSSILRVETKLDNLEQGRLSNLERDVSSIQGRLMVIPILISIAMGIFSFFLNRMVLK